MKIPNLSKISLLKIKRELIILCCAFIFIQFSDAQTVTVSGKVTEAISGKGIPGASVIDQSSGTGVISDLDGNYSIEAENGSVLEFSFVGKISQDIAITDQTQVDIVLEEDVIGLEQVVVVGYGTQKKADLTSSIAVVDGEEMARKPVSTFEQALQGLSAGVSVTGNRGTPGEGALIRIRGVGTVNNTQPLIVVDGIAAESSLSVAPADIESVQVLKDAAAAAIYGARGANGVVLITTKRGVKGQSTINFEAYYGVQKAWKQMDLLNAENYSKLANETNYNAGSEGPIATIDPYNPPYDTDWQAAMFQTAPMQNYSLSFSGGNEWNNYYISGGYLSQDGIMLGTAYERYHLRVNNDAKIGRLKFGESLNLSYSQKENEPSSGGRSQIEQILKITPTMPIYDSTNLGGYAGPENDDGHDGANPVGVAGTHIGEENIVGIAGNIYLDFEIIKGLNFVSRLGADYRTSDYSFLLKAHEMGSAGGVDETKQENTASSYSSLIFENTLSYFKEFGNHSIKALIGYTSESRTKQFLYGSRTDFPSDDLTLHAGLSQINNDGQKYESSILSQLARIEYGYRGKYLLTANIRRDGSSKFGSNYRWGVFPSFSAGWRISQENFMSSIPTISDMKLRGSYGKIGNQDIGDYAYEASLSSYYRYSFNNALVTGMAPDVLPNPDVHWETTTITDIGLDMGFFKNKFYLTTDYYIKKTSDMLVQVPIPGSAGFWDAYPYQNAGSILNKGWEFSASYKEYEGAFNFSVTGHIAFNHNEVLSIGEGGIPIISGTVENQKSGVTRTDVGDPIGSFYVYRTDGLFGIEDAEIDEDGRITITNQPFYLRDLADGSVDTFYMQGSAQPGDVRYLDLDGDARLTDNDREVAGSPIPKIEYGINFSASFKGFDLTLFFQGVYGNKIYNENKVWTQGMFGVWNGSSATLDRYRMEDVTITRVTDEGEEISVDYPANTNTDVPRAILRDPNKNTLRGNDRFLEDGAYLRLKTFTIGYSLPDKVIKKISASRFRIYFTGQNLLTFTKYTGYDPEIGSNPIGDSNGPINLVRGIDNGYYPQARTLLGGIQLTF